MIGNEGVIYKKRTLLGGGGGHQKAYGNVYRGGRMSYKMRGQLALQKLKFSTKFKFSLVLPDIIPDKTLDKILTFFTIIR